MLAKSLMQRPAILSLYHTPQFSATASKTMPEIRLSSPLALGILCLLASTSTEAVDQIGVPLEPRQPFRFVASQQHFVAAALVSPCARSPKERCVGISNLSNRLTS